MRRWLLAGLGVVAVVVGAACDGGGTSRSDAVAAIASGVAVPRFEAVRDETSELARAVEALCAAAHSGASGEASLGCARQTGAGDGG